MNWVGNGCPLQKTDCLESNRIRPGAPGSDIRNVPDIFQSDPALRSKKGKIRKTVVSAPIRRTCVLPAAGNGRLLQRETLPFPTGLSADAQQTGPVYGHCPDTCLCLKPCFRLLSTPALNSCVSIGAIRQESSRMSRSMSNNIRKTVDSIVSRWQFLCRYGMFA